MKTKIIKFNVIGFSIAISDYGGSSFHFPTQIKCEARIDEGIGFVEFLKNQMKEGGKIEISMKWDHALSLTWNPPRDIENKMYRDVNPGKGDCGKRFCFFLGGGDDVKFYTDVIFEE